MKKLTGMQQLTVVLLLLLCSGWRALPAGAQEVEPARTPALDSVFAIVTHKAGFAASRGHNHIIVASDGDLAVSFDELHEQAAAISFAGKVENLVVDDPLFQREVGQRMVEFGVLSEVPAEIDSKSRDKIYRSMLGSKQLEASTYPALKARLRSVVRADKQSAHGTIRFDYRATVELEIHGKSAARVLDARLERQGERLMLEALGTFKFTDFGIEPFSAFLGAVKNEDTFHAYARIELAAP